MIRREAANDNASIRRVVAAAFGSDIEADLVDRIRASPQYVPELALVAERDGEIVGHVMISGASMHNASGNRPIMLLSPLAVDPVHQKQGIGGQLVRAVVALADQRGEPLVVLEGSVKYYSRFGFQFSVPHGIEMHLPEWAAPESAQVMLLTTYDASDDTLKGMVVYPPAFDGLT